MFGKENYYNSQCEELDNKKGKNKIFLPEDSRNKREIQTLTRNAA